MKCYCTEYRVSYSDTDQMSFVHHSNYLRYYETARWELFRSIGLTYRDVENEGIILPVISASLKFIRPAFYDQKIFIETALKSFKGPRIVFESCVKNDEGNIINEAQVTVACVNRDTGKACFPSKKIKDILNVLLSDKEDGKS